MEKTDEGWCPEPADPGVGDNPPHHLPLNWFLGWRSLMPATAQREPPRRADSGNRTIRIGNHSAGPSLARKKDTDGHADRTEQKDEQVAAEIVVSAGSCEN